MREIIVAHGVGHLPCCECLNFKSLESFRRKQLFRLEAALRQTLLVVIAQEGVQAVAVGLEAVRDIQADVAQGIEAA